MHQHLTKTVQAWPRREPLVVALLLMLVLLIIATGSTVGASMPHTMDCMKNPFASGCRGISAKRSVPSAAIQWPPHQAAIMRPLSALDALNLSQRAPTGCSSKQLQEAARLLVNAVNRLVYELAFDAQRNSALSQTIARDD